jgi:two-component system, cell cycle response regulator
MSHEDKTQVSHNFTDPTLNQHLYDVLIVIGGHLNGTIFEINKALMSVGRNNDCDIHLNYPGISRVHFTIYSGKDVYIEDLKSSNGTYLNDQRISEKVILQSGDTINLGQVAFKFFRKDSAEINAHVKLIDQATKDGLTGCFNKRYLFDVLERELKQTYQSGENLSLIVIDIDFFKKLNDTQGHDAGDFILKSMAAVIAQQHIRERDVFARFGGEEFVILLMDTASNQAFQIAENIRRTIEQQVFLYSRKPTQITVSIGVAETNSKNMMNAQDLFKHADQALYQSKQTGRNKTTVYKL